jgi:hypothetical protein
LSGSYQVVVTRSGAASLAHLIELKEAEVSLQVDLAFEGALFPKGKSCVFGAEGAQSENARLGQAVKFGTLLNASEVVAVRLERQSAGPSWLSASRIQVQSGQKVREGGLKVQDTSRVPEGLGELAHFIVTGQPTAQVFTERPTDIGPTALRSAGHSSVKQQEAIRASTPSPVLWGAASLGIVAAGVGTLFQIQAANSWAQFNSYWPEGGSPGGDELAVVQDLRLRAQRQQAIAVAAFSTSAVAAGVCTLLFFKNSSQPGKLSGAVSSDGKAVHLELKAVWP